MTNGSLNQLRQTTAAYQESSLLAAAAELDIFTVILEHQNRQTASELVDVLATNERGTEMILDALTAAGYLRKTDDVYSVADAFALYLNSRNTETYIPMIRHMACVQRAWARLAEAVKTGTPPDVPPSILGKEQDRMSFIWAMNSVAQTLVTPTLESLRHAGLLTFTKLLDIGGASGTYTQAFLDALPEAVATIFDLPSGITAARKRFCGSQYEHRVQFAEGDFFRNDFPTGFDFAWVSAIIHQFSRNESRELYRKVFQSLQSGGKVAVRDFLMNPDRTSPAAGTLFGINMLVETPLGMVYTFDEVREDLESVGFINVVLAVPAETMSAVVTAEKPE